MIQYPLTVNGVTTRVLDSGVGSGGGEPQLLVHGVGARADRFRLNIQPLADAGHRVVAIDLPGHGLAQKGVLPYSVPFYSSFVLAVLDELGMEEAGIIGTSLGGQIGAYTAVHKPERVRSLVMIGTMGVVPLGIDARMAISRSITNRSRDGIADKLAFVLQRTDLITADWVEEEFRINNSPGAQEAFEQLSDYFRNGVDDDVVGDQLAQVTGSVRTLLVWGADDKMISATVGHAAQSLLTSTPLVLLRDAGHVPYMERPEAFNDLVVRFLSGQLEDRLVQTL